MSRGKRYDGEPKLNLKKVFAVIIAFAVIIMFIIGINKLFTGESNTEEKTVSLAYFPVYTEGKWGVIDSKGNTIITPEYDEYIVIPDNTQPVFICTYDVNYEDGTYKTKALNEKNEQIYTEYEQVEALENYDESNNLWYTKNILKVVKDGKYGLLNTSNGALVVNCEYDEIEALKGVENSFITEKDNKYGLVDNIGTVILESNYEDIKPLTNEYEDGFIVENEEGKYSLTSYGKQEILKPIYDEIKQTDGDNNYYIVREGQDLEVVDSDGQKYLVGEYDDIISVNNGNAIVENNNKYGVVNVDGTEVIKPDYDSISYASGNNYIVEANNKFGVINTDNEQLIDTKYDNIVYRSTAGFYEATNSDYTSDLIDNNMEVKLSGVIVSEVNESDGYIKVRQDGEYKYYNFRFEEKTPKEILSGNTIFLSKNEEGKYGFVDRNGNVVVNYIYDDATEQNDYGYASVKLDGKWGAVDSRGNVTVEPTYTLENNTRIEFIGKWHLGEDLNLYYFTDNEA